MASSPTTSIYHRTFNILQTPYLSSSRGGVPRLAGRRRLYYIKVPLVSSRLAGREFRGLLISSLITFLFFFNLRYRFMSDILLAAFVITLIYLGVANRLTNYVTALAFQGIILFGVAFIELIEIHWVNLIFVLLETIIFKTIAIPYFLNYVIQKNNITRDSEPFLPDFISIVIVTGILLGSFLLSNAIQDPHLRKIFFVAALSALFTGLYIIVTRRKIITHVMGFLVIENGVFILSLAVGSQMPMLVNIGILLDIFASVFLLGIFVNKIGDVLKEQDVEQLSNLRD